ncbi:MAG: heavy metal translocating P-type ATPase [Oscillospiraceae bacterium]|jgi:Cd2+/Zn2+-exporting ATPase|nr:heavy metal translocating P-type ATPase [Oscillospiraceae bacterium]
MTDKQKFYLRFGASAVLLLTGLVLEQTGGNEAITICLFVAAYLLAGFDIIYWAVKGLFKGEFFSETVLMTISSAGAFAIGMYGEGAAVMLFYQLGEHLSEIAADRARDSVTKLCDLRADSVAVIRGGETLRVKPDEVAVGEEFTVKPGERVPIDCVILSGDTSLDLSALTGESEPVFAEVGDNISSGTINLSGVITAKSLRLAGDSAAARILSLVQHAAERKSKAESFITRFARVYTPVVVSIGVIIGVVLPLLFHFDIKEWIYRGLMFLVISCPCALVVSVPLTFFAGIGAASRHGILVKGANRFDKMANITVAAFDKTGTLTKGTFTVNESAALGVERDTLLQLAAAAESVSSHPIARAVVKYADMNLNSVCLNQRGESPTLLRSPRPMFDKKELTNIKETAGKGVDCVYKGKVLVAGNAALLADFGVIAPQVEAHGTVLFVAYDGKAAGYFLLGDEVKANAAKTIRELKSLGVKKTVMLSGDRNGKAESLGRDIGIDEVFAELSPSDKYDKLQLLEKATGDKGAVLYVGDGLNDTPVLARADVGAAMGGLGSDGAVEAADIVIMDDDPYRLVIGIKIAKRTRFVAGLNIALALTVKFAVQILALLGIATMWAAVFADVGVLLLTVGVSVVGTRVKV